MKGINDFNSLHQTISYIIYGERQDIILNKINKFIIDLNIIYRALKDNNFPSLILDILYTPITLTILLLNCIKDEIIYFSVRIVIFCAIVFIMGGISAVIYLAYNGFVIYN